MGLEHQGHRLFDGDLFLGDRFAQVTDVFAAALGAREVDAAVLALERRAALAQPQRPIGVLHRRHLQRLQPQDFIARQAHVAEQRPIAAKPT